jgi:hypothetical protein
MGRGERDSRTTQARTGASRKAIHPKDGSAGFPTNFEPQFL